MLNLFLSDIPVVMPIIIFGVFVIAVVVVIAILAAKKQQSTNSSSTYYQMQSQQRQGLSQIASRDGSCDVHTHIGNVAVAKDGHSHVGAEEERYEKIVGSLGEVDDEGCADMDGIRLIAHDEAYEGESETRSYNEIGKAIVWGEVLDKPRCKNSRK